MYAISLLTRWQVCNVVSRDPPSDVLRGIDELSQFLDRVQRFILHRSCGAACNKRAIV